MRYFTPATPTPTKSPTKPTAVGSQSSDEGSARLMNPLANRIAAGMPTSNPAFVT